MNAADWVQSQLGSKGHQLTPEERAAVDLLGFGLKCGIYDVPVRWDRVEWGGRYAVFTLYAGGGLGSHDFDHLTRLVVAAHDRCLRVVISPCAPKYLRIFVGARDRLDASISRGHPTLEAAIAKIRGLNA